MKWHLFNFSESRICPNVPKCGLNTRLDNCEVAWSYTYSIFRKTEFVCPNINRMFRSVGWTHDMIIVKWHLLIWHKRKLCALTNTPPVQSAQTDRWLSTLFHANYSATQVYVLHPRQLRHFRSELQATIIVAGITIPLSAKKDILKVFVYLMMRNVMVKTCLNQKIIKNSNLIQAMMNSVCLKAKVIRRPNFSESRICPNIYRMFQSVDRTHDMIIVKWHEVTPIHFFGKPNLSEYLPNVPKCG